MMKGDGNFDEQRMVRLQSPSVGRTGTMILAVVFVVCVGILSAIGASGPVVWHVSCAASPARL
jgi:hypothetical protein